jgi:hypothetical protein
LIFLKKSKSQKDKRMKNYKREFELVKVKVIWISYNGDSESSVYGFNRVSDTKEQDYITPKLIARTETYEQKHWEKRAEHKKHEGHSQKSNTVREKKEYCKTQKAYKNNETHKPKELRLSVEYKQDKQNEKHT